MILPIGSDFLGSEHNLDLRDQNQELCVLWRCVQNGKNDPCWYCRIASDLCHMANEMHCENPQFAIVNI